MTPFLEELKQRRVVRVALVYGATAFVGLQLADILAPALRLPDWTMTLVVVLLALGFPLALVLSWAFELTAQGVRRAAAEPTAGEPPPQWLGGRTVAAVAGLVLFGMGLSAGWFFRTAPGTDAGSTLALDATRVAVLPFRNANPSDEESALLALGVHDDLLTRISRIRALRVVSRTSVEEYRHTTKRIAAIAAELGAGAILEGNVQRVGENVRINVQLIDAARDEHLWAESYDRRWSLDNLFAIQTEIAEQVATALSAALTSEDRASLAARPTGDEEAYRAYVRATDLASRSNAAAETWQAIVLLEQAVARDPGFASAWAWLGRMHAWAFWGRYDRTEARLAQARRALDRALALDPVLPDARAARGFYHYWGFLDHEAAVAEFQRALAGDQDHADALGGLAAVRRSQGRMQEAVALATQRLAADPRNALAHAFLAHYLGMLGHFDEGLAHWEQATAITPEVLRRPDAAMIRLAAGDLDGLARTLGESASAGAPNNTLRFYRVQLHRLRRDYPGALEAVAGFTDPEEVSFNLRLLVPDQLAGDLFRLAGRADSANARYRAAAARLERRVREQPEDEFGWSALGLAYAGLGRKADAIRAAERAVVLMPISKEAVNGAARAADLAAVYAQVGDTGRAVALLEELIDRPLRLVISPALLRLDPLWDPLRGDPRFTALTQRPARFQ